MELRGHILVVEDDAATRATAEALLRSAGLRVHAAESAEAALLLLESVVPEVVLLDLGLPGQSGGELLVELRRRLRHTPVVVLTAHREAEVAVECMKAGAFDYLVKPPDDVRLLTTVANAQHHCALSRTVASLEGARGAASAPWVAGTSAAVLGLARDVEAAAEGDRPVLLLGEPGTERDAVARLVHERSRRAAGPFLTIRCGLLTAQQQEELIFGAGAGAGAGRLVEAASGTLYLEDVEALSPAAQERLVAALALAARGRSSGVAASDFRLVASTTLDLAGLVRRKRFAAELYMRLASAEVQVPPLRARGADVLLLARSELAAMAGPAGPAALGREAEAALLAHPWPGNLEELRQALRRAVEASGGAPLEARHLTLGTSGAPPRPAGPLTPGGDTLRLADRERDLILAALEQAAGDRSAASRALGVSRSTIYRKLKEYGIE